MCLIIVSLVESWIVSIVACPSSKSYLILSLKYLLGCCWGHLGDNLLFFDQFWLYAESYCIHMLDIFIFWLYAEPILSICYMYYILVLCRVLIYPHASHLNCGSVRSLNLSICWTSDILVLCRVSICPYAGHLIFWFLCGIWACPYAGSFHSSSGQSFSLSIS